MQLSLIDPLYDINISHRLKYLLMQENFIKSRTNTKFYDDKRQTILQQVIAVIRKLTAAVYCMHQKCNSISTKPAEFGARRSIWRRNGRPEALEISWLQGKMLWRATKALAFLVLLICIAKSHSGKYDAATRYIMIT